MRPDIRRPDLWATVAGKPIGLFDAKIVYAASNQPGWLLGQHEPAFIQTDYPETYILTFNQPLGWAAPSADKSFDINSIRFKIDSCWPQPDGSMGYEAIGWPIQVAATIPRDQTPYFAGWDDVGYDYLDDRDRDYDYEA